MRSSCLPLEILKSRMKPSPGTRPYCPSARSKSSVKAPTRPPDSGVTMGNPRTQWFKWVDHRTQYRIASQFNVVLMENRMNSGMVDKPVPHVLPSLMATKSGISYFDTKPAKQIKGLCTSFVLKPWQGCVPLGKIHENPL